MRRTEPPSFYLHHQSVRFDGRFAEIQKIGTLRLARAPRYPLHRVQGTTVSNSTADGTPPHRSRPGPTAATGLRGRRWGARQRAGGQVLRRSEIPRGRDDGCRAPPAASAATSPAAPRHRDPARPPAGFAGRARNPRIPEQEPDQGCATAQRAPRAHRPAFGCAAARLHTIACCPIHPSYAWRASVPGSGRPAAERACAARQVCAGGLGVPQLWRRERQRHQRGGGNRSPSNGAAPGR